MIILPANLETLSTLKDGTIKITLETNEITPADFGVLYSYRNKYGFFAFKPELFDEKQKQILCNLKVTDFDNVKSPSKRMRDVLFRLWEQDNEGFNDPNLYYINKTEKIIEHLKSKFKN